MKILPFIAGAATIYCLPSIQQAHLTLRLDVEMVKKYFFQGYTASKWQSWDSAMKAHVLNHS